MPDFAATIAANVRAERGRRRWRQADLGERIGWTVSQVSALETGGRDVHANDLPLLCRAFGISIAELGVYADPADLTALRIG